MNREFVQAYAGWYPLSNRTVLEIRSEGPYLVAYCSALFESAPLIPKSDTEFDLNLEVQTKTERDLPLTVGECRPRE